MRILAMASILLITACATAEAGHSTGNDTCDDDILHWSNMIEKRSDAPLYEKSKVMAELAQKKVDVWGCENFMEEALRMIRNPYPTE